MPTVSGSTLWSQAGVEPNTSPTRPAKGVVHSEEKYMQPTIIALAVYHACQQIGAAWKNQQFLKEYLKKNPPLVQVAPPSAE